MKFCTKCGKELNDEAVICVGCGCAVKSAEPKIAPQKESPAVKEKPKNSAISTSFGITSSFIAIVGILLTFVGTAISIVEMANADVNFITNIPDTLLNMAFPIFGIGLPILGLVLEIVGITLSIVGRILNRDNNFAKNGFQRSLAAIIFAISMLVVSICFHIIAIGYY